MNGISHSTAQHPCNLCHILCRNLSEVLRATFQHPPWKSNASMLQHSVLNATYWATTPFSDIFPTTLQGLIFDHLLQNIMAFNATGYAAALYS